ncbi:serine hydrolase domain-containing protein [Pacificimonas sp. ICDLI1SI03]
MKSTLMLGPLTALALLSACARPGAQSSAVSATASTAVAAAPAATVSTSFENLQALADRYVAERKVANMVIGVSRGEAPPVWIQAGTLGLERPTAADEQSIYRIYSMTKPIVGVAAALLIEKGEFALDQPVSDFFPEYADMQVVVDRAGDIGDTRPATTPITIRHLLTHTSGLTYQFQPNSVASAYRAAGILPAQRRVGALPGDGEQPESLAKFATRLASLPLVAEPGTEWHYSVSMDLMGAIIEEATGEALDQHLQRVIFDPLGMEDTGFVVPQADNDRLTTNYFIAGKMPPAMRLPVPEETLIPIDAPPDSEYNAAAAFPAGGGGLASTPQDYLRFLRAVAALGMVDGRQIFPRAAIEMATSDLLPQNVQFLASPALDLSGPAQGYGAGGRVVVDGSGGEPVGSYGWGGAAGTLGFAQPATGTSIVMMTQYMPQDAYGLAGELSKAVAADMKALGVGR